MISAYIDSASIHGVIAAMIHPEIDQWPAWTLWSAVETTSALINNPMFEIVPGPSSYSGDRGLMDHTMRSLALIVSHSKPEPSQLIQARNRVKRWAGRNPVIVREAYKKVQGDESYQGWLDCAITNFLVAHSASLEGLFDQQFIPQLTRVLNCSGNDLRNIWDLSRDLKQVEYWAKKRPNTGDFRLAIDAFVVAALLRGRFHDHIAEAANLQILHHPIRYPVLQERKEGTVFALTNTEKCFTSIILTGALCESKAENRISLWAENTIKARKAVSEGIIDLSKKDSNGIAENTAMNAAKRLGLRTYSRLEATVLDVLLSLVIDGLSCFMLQAWAGIPPIVSLPIGPALDGAIKYKTGLTLGDRAASWVCQDEVRLRDLAKAVPGRIKGKWN